MARQTKIQDMAEARRWLVDEGRTLRWCQERYLTKYHLETSLSLWSRLHKKFTGETRVPPRGELMPWHLKDEHRNMYIPHMLRVIDRMRRGIEVSDLDRRKAESWLEKLNEADAVVHYDPDTAQGWWMFPREPQDRDIIRQPRGERTIRL